MPSAGSSVISSGTMSSARHRKVAFAPFVKLFADLGWERLVVPRSHNLFSDPRSDDFIMLPLAKGGRVPAYYVQVVGRTLDEWGVLERADVERRLIEQPRAVARPSRSKRAPVATT